MSVLHCVNGSNEQLRDELPASKWLYLRLCSTNTDENVLCTQQADRSVATLVLHDNVCPFGIQVCVPSSCQVPPPPPLSGPQRSPRANRPSRCHQNRIGQPDAGWLFAVDSRDRGCQPRGRGVGEGTGGRRTGNRLLGRLGSRCDPAISRRRCRKPWFAIVCVDFGCSVGGTRRRAECARFLHAVKELLF